VKLQLQVFRTVCPVCSYELDGHIVVCPECGSLVTPTRSHARRNNRTRYCIFYLIFIGLCVLSLIAYLKTNNWIIAAYIMFPNVLFGISFTRFRVLSIAICAVCLCAYVLVATILLVYGVNIVAILYLLMYILIGCALPVLAGALLGDKE
jgi:predicted nucleic acid-binding Zn ribbon protein